VPRITWGAVGERFFEVGVDRGVLYVDALDGVPWNGLVSVSESPTGAEAEPFYIDGVKYANHATAEEFEGTIEAYTYPDEFSLCEGTAPVSNGLFAAQQRKKAFGLCYRTLVGNDIDGLDHAYKLHLVYNAMVAPSERSNGSVAESIDPDNFSWAFTTTPVRPRGYKPTAHFVIDSRDMSLHLRERIEDVLYGTDEDSPRLPSVAELVYIFESETASIFDAGSPIEPFYGTFDGGVVPELQTSTVDGGAP
jgi:hypothetical protein